MSDSTQFMGTPVAADDAKFWVIPGNEEHTAQLRVGQKDAPEAIIAASLHVPMYDEEVAMDVTVKAPICTVEGGDSDTVRAAFEAAFEMSAVPVVLGGTPSVSLAGIQALGSSAEEFTILHISARSNMRDPIGATASQTVMRTALGLKNMKKIVQVGLMSLNNDESDLVFDEDSKVEPFFACDIARAEDESWHEDVIQELATPVYMSIDVSAISRSVVPGAGTPEPGGFEWWPLLRLIKKVTSRRRIAAFDLVNLIPCEKNPTSAYVGARLVYKIMAYILAGGKML